MNKVLISWIALKNDFEDHRVNLQGPTFNFHQYFFKGYAKHIILTTENESKDSKCLKLKYAINSTFPENKVEIIYLNLVEKDVIDFNKIHSSIYPILLEYSECQIDIFVSPGTPTMQVVWYMVSQELDNIKLLQTIRKEETRLKSPQLSEIKINQSLTAGYYFLKENISKKKDKNFLETKSISHIYRLAEEIALASKTTVLIKGDTGTGKENLASHIKVNSDRKNKPFESINCGAFNSELLESRLFGYEKGAFTHAVESKTGYFQAVDGGTIFLDEIGDISPQMQVSLLRFLQNGEIQKVGSNSTEKVDVRVIAATNKDLYSECEKGNFRWDLYYRLNVAVLELPALKQRGQKEISQLLEFFNQKYFIEFRGKRKKLNFESDTIQILWNHTWPGNIRELQNFIESCYAYGYENIKIEHLPKSIILHKNRFSKKLEDVKKNHVQEVVFDCNGNLTEAMKILDVGSLNTIKKYLNNKG